MMNVMVGHLFYDSIFYDNHTNKCEMKEMCAYYHRDQITRFLCVAVSVLNLDTVTVYEYAFALVQSRHILLPMLSLLLLLLLRQSPTMNV